MANYRGVKVNGKKRDYHRWIMEQELGRELTRNEVVHHINEDIRDNDINNLCVMSLAEHSRMHRQGKTTSAETKKKLSLANIGKPSAIPRKLTDEQVVYIRENYLPGDKKFGTRALSREFEVHHSTIERIVHDKTYRD